MEKLAFINGDTFIYWSPIMLALAAMTAIGIYCAVYLWREKSIQPAAVSVALSIGLSIPLARLIHWYCRTPSYESFRVAMTDFSEGGYALMGVFFGCLLAAVLTRVLRFSRNLPRMLDAMSLGGCAGIAVGRLASLFNTSDRGMIVPENVGFPFAAPIVNTVSGTLDNRLATFMIQSVLAAGILLLLVGYLAYNSLRKNRIPDGNLCMIFLLCYGAGQIICDSTRYDSLFLRSNGFVSIVQILSLVALLIPMAWFGIRMVRRRGFQNWYLLLWTAVAALLGLAGYMEYYVQRHGNEAVFAYSVMGSCLAAAVLLGLVECGISSRQAPIESK